MFALAEIDIKSNVWNVIFILYIFLDFIYFSHIHVQVLPILEDFVIEGCLQETPHFAETGWQKMTGPETRSAHGVEKDESQQQQNVFFAIKK